MFTTCWNPLALVAHNNFMDGKRLPRLFWQLTHVLPGVLALPTAFLVRQSHASSSVTATAVTGMWLCIIAGAVMDKLFQPRWHGAVPYTIAWVGWRVTNYPDFFGDLWVTAIPALILAGQWNPWLLIPTYLATVVSDPYPTG